LLVFFQNDLGFSEEDSMKRIAVVLVFLMLLFALAAQAQTPPPGPEHKKLGMYVGTWTGENKSEANPFGKGGISKNTRSCAWFTGEYQVVCDVEESGPIGKTKSLEILGYSSEKKQYFLFYITGAGKSGMIPGNVDNSVWTWTWDGVAASKTYHVRLTAKYPSPTERTSKAEYSEDGKNWKLAEEGKMTKK
jgi:hypothetical protein